MEMSNKWKLKAKVEVVPNGEKLRTSVQRGRRRSRSCQGRVNLGARGVVSDKAGNLEDRLRRQLHWGAGSDRGDWERTPSREVEAGSGMGEQALRELGRLRGSSLMKHLQEHWAPFQMDTAERASDPQRVSDLLLDCIRTLGLPPHWWGEACAQAKVRASRSSCKIPEPQPQSRPGTAQISNLWDLKKIKGLSQITGTEMMSLLPCLPAATKEKS